MATLAPTTASVPLQGYVFNGEIIRSLPPRGLVAWIVVLNSP